MERDNFEISQEQEQMREQFRILTEKVEKQNIVYEKQLRASMRKRVNSYNLWEVWMPIIVPFYMEYVKALNRTVGISQEVLIVTIILMGIILGLDMYLDTRKGRLLDNIIKEIEE